MNYVKLKKISKFLFLAYICLLAIAWVKYIPIQKNLEVKYFAIVYHLNDGSWNEYLKYWSFLFASMVPIGVLVPFSTGQKCRNKTYCCGITIILVMEISRLAYFGGTVCLDDIFVAFIGVVIGYSIHKPMSKVLKCGARFQWTKENKKKGWIVYLLLIMASVVAYINIDSISDYVEATKLRFPQFLTNDFPQIEKSITAYDELSVYDITFEALKNHQTSITYSGINIDTDIIHKEYIRVLNEHPEFFWLTGGGVGKLSSNGVFSTYVYEPTVFGTINEIPHMEEVLMMCVDDVISQCPAGSEYDKALWIHDMLIYNIEYDVNTFYTNMSSVSGDTPYDYAYTAYGALINRRAVCAGYSKAYQLILNRMGIECGYITGNAVNDIGSGPHAWNYVKLDGNYYQVDVTWDDPICFGYTNNEIRHDFFALTYEQMGRDHFADPGQDIPNSMN